MESCSVMSLFVMRGLIYPLLYLLVMLLGMYGVNSTFVGGYMYFCSREGQGKVEHRTHLGVDRRDGNSPCYGTCSLVYVICYIIYFWYGSLVEGASVWNKVHKYKHIRSQFRVCCKKHFTDIISIGELFTQYG